MYVISNKGVVINMGVRQQKLVALKTVNNIEMFLSSVPNRRITSIDIRWPTIVYTLKNDIQRTINKIP